MQQDAQQQHLDSPCSAVSALGLLPAVVLLMQPAPQMASLMGERFREAGHIPQLARTYIKAELLESLES